MLFNDGEELQARCSQFRGLQRAWICNFIVTIKPQHLEYMARYKAGSVNMFLKTPPTMGQEDGSDGKGVCDASLTTTQVECMESRLKRSQSRGCTSVTQDSFGVVELEAHCPVSLEYSAQHKDPDLPTSLIPVCRTWRPAWNTAKVT